LKYLIVTGDDFGASSGINRGILEAHRDGILTSASLMVNLPWSADAASLSRAAPQLALGLHIELAGEALASAGARRDAVCRASLDQQFSCFATLVGRMPTHLDSHHNVHRNPRLLPHFLDLARQHNLPLREHSAVRYLSSFYGQWGGETHLEAISVPSLLNQLETALPDSVTELGCHPGYVGPDLHSSYSIEREIELRTLVDPILPRMLAAQQFQLISFRDLSTIHP
jgi:chitin disaccharide deacetylase